MKGFSRVAAWLVLAAACAVVIGWVVGVRTITSLVPGYNTMKFNTAICLALLATAILIGPRLARWVPLALVALVTSATLVEILWNSSLGIDEALFRDVYTTGGAPGRMAPATAVALLTLAVAIALSDSGSVRVIETIVAVPMLLSATALLGYLYDVEQLYTVASLSSVAVHTAGAILGLSLAVLAIVPNGLLAWAIRGRGPGATVVRQTTPIIVVGLTLLGLIRMRLGDAGAFGEHFGIALMVLVGIVIAIGVCVRAARRLDVADEARVQAEVALRDLADSLREGRDEAWARAEVLADELAMERRRFDSAITSTESIVWTVETTNGGPIPIYTSPNVERVLGHPLLPGETATAALARLVDEDQRDAALDFRSSVRQGVPAESELRLSVHGRAKWLRVYGVPRREDDRVFYDGIIIDSTEEHLVSEQREVLLLNEQLQVERLSELNRVRDEFIAVAGHELRTPVAVILGYLEMLGDPAASAADKVESIEVITRRAQQLNELVERVFDLARIDAGAMDLHLETMSASDFVADLLLEHRPRAEAAGVSLSAEVVPANVLVDVARLQQVFDNLLSNALKYTPAGGHVTLTIAENGGEVVFIVRDDGIGVSPEELPRLFDKLFRATTAREANIPGTGLGLAVTKALVEAHRGTMTATANQPHGMVFSVSLPSGSHS